MELFCGLCGFALLIAAMLERQRTGIDTRDAVGNVSIRLMAAECLEKSRIAPRPDRKANRDSPDDPN